MSISIHDPEWDEMKGEFIELLSSAFGNQYVAMNLTDSLFSIMNDFGAVTYT